RGGAGNSRIVDQHVETIQFFLHVQEQPVQVGGPADVAHRPGDPRVSFGGFPYGFLVDVDDVNARAVGGEGLGHDQADSAGTGGDENTLAHWGFLCGVFEASDFSSSRNASMRALRGRPSLNSRRSLSWPDSFTSRRFCTSSMMRKGST